MRGFAIELADEHICVAFLRAESTTRIRKETNGQMKLNVVPTASSAACGVGSETDAMN